MRNGRFNPSKYRGKLQKMEVLYTHSSKMPGSSSTLQKIIKIKSKNGGVVHPFFQNARKFFNIPKDNKNKIKKFEKIDGSSLQGRGRPPAALRSHFILHTSPFFPPSSSTFGHFGQLHLIGSSTCPPCPYFS
jgi:hypothetical protein